VGADWIPNVGYGQPFGTEVTSAGFVGVLPLVGTGLGVDPAGNQVGVPDTDPESLLVHRTVGQIDFLNASQEDVDLTVNIRFTKGLYSQATGAIEVFTEDLNDPQDANEQFTHERRFELVQGVGTFDVRVDPAWSMYDIRAKRTLRAAEWYCAVIEVQKAGSTTGADGVLILTAFLRSWVTFKG